MFSFETAFYSGARFVFYNIYSFQMENGGSALKISYFRTQYYFRRMKFMGLICAKLNPILKILFEIAEACMRVLKEKSFFSVITLVQFIIIPK